MRLTLDGFLVVAQVVGLATQVEMDVVFDVVPIPARVDLRGSKRAQKVSRMNAARSLNTQILHITLLPQRTPTANV